MAMHEPITIYCRTFWWVYVKVNIYNCLFKTATFKGKCNTHSFKFKGKNYLWIYWIKLYRTK